MNRSITNNTLLNIAGQMIPIGFALLAIPNIIEGVGTDRFGILSIAWLVIGYFSLFDLGLGRALTQLVADRRADANPAALAAMVWTALFVMSAMGAVGGVVIAGVSPWLATTVFKVPATLQAETVNTFFLLSAGIPIVVMSAGFVGLLTAFDRFDLINAVRTPLGISNFAAPLVVLPFSQSLVDITVVLVICRAAAALVQAVLCLRIMPALKSSFRFEATELYSLMHFGGWMSVTNIIGPMMVYFDRFLIGATISVSAVAYYATPYEVATKLLILPAAISATLFPKFASTYRTDPQSTLILLIRGCESVLILLLPILLVAVVFAEEGLNLWLNNEFASNSHEVLQWLSIGILFNSLAQMPFALIQGAARPDLSAKAHLAELVVYLPLLWIALSLGGIIGAAQAWAARAALDCLLLSAIAGRLAPGFNKYTRRVLPYLAALIVGVIAITQADLLAARVSLGLVTFFLGILLVTKLDILPLLKSRAANKLKHIRLRP